MAIGPTLSCETRAVAVAVCHPLATRTQVRWDDLADYSVADIPGLAGALPETLVPAATPSGRSLRRHAAVHTMAEVIAAVTRGQIVHPTVADAAQFRGEVNVVLIPLADAEPLPRFSSTLTSLRRGPWPRSWTGPRN
ncbi:MAG: hypothetical protein ABI808_08225 [Pseudonocardiales bacterium]